MRYFLADEAVLKWLETPSVYHIKKDELYELDDESFEFLKLCSTKEGCDSDKSEFIAYCLDEEILSSDIPSIKQPVLIKSPVPSLRYLELQITDRCNLRCGHCYIGDISTLPSDPSPQGNELSINQIRTILTGFEQMQGLRLLITGGEPLVHSGFHQINAMLPDFSFRKVLFTNGLLLNKKIIDDLNINEIQVSIDGLENAHDLLRGKGTFKAAMEAIKLCTDSGFEVSVSTMVHAGNLGDFAGMDGLFRKTGVKDWTVDVPCITGRLKDNIAFQLSPEMSGKYLAYGYGAGLHSGAPGFGCGLHLMSVSANGRVSKCTFYSDRPAGRIEEGLMECWHNIKPVRLDELKCDCRHLESCRGGCRYRAEILGDPFGKDLYRCVLYDII
jgi:radical SAM protein with 4Fe4S-binding SPASM domain